MRTPYIGCNRLTNEITFENHRLRGLRTVKSAQKESSSLIFFSMQEMMSVKMIYYYIFPSRPTEICWIQIIFLLSLVLTKCIRTRTRTRTRMGIRLGNRNRTTQEVHFESFVSVYLHTPCTEGAIAQTYAYTYNAHIHWLLNFGKLDPNTFNRQIARTTGLVFGIWTDRIDEHKCYVLFC